LALYVPQEQMEITEKNAYANSIMIVKMDTDQLLSSQFMIAVLDGASIDVGVATDRCCLPNRNPYYWFIYGF